MWTRISNYFSVVVPLKAEEHARAIPYPIKMEAGVAKRARAVELAVVKEARAAALLE